MLPLPPGEFRAYLFDCDGTVVDSMPLHLVAWRQALAEWDCDISEELFYAWGGRTLVDIVADLGERHGVVLPVQDVIRRQEALYRELLPTLAAVPEVGWHIEQAYGSVPFAVVSGGNREAVTASLATLGLLDRFDLLVCAGDYVRAKPDPECFLLAARLLGVPPESCLVFEDTDLGIAAATAAGMAAVRVPPPWQRAVPAPRSGPAGAEPAVS